MKRNIRLHATVGLHLVSCFFAVALFTFFKKNVILFLPAAHITIEEKTFFMRDCHYCIKNE